MIVIKGQVNDNNIIHNITPDIFGYLLEDQCVRNKQRGLDKHLESQRKW